MDSTPHDAPRPSRAPGTLVIGVMGGIASGKSAVARALAGADGWVLDADKIAHRALEAPAVRAWLRQNFGEQVFGADGVDRPALAARVFTEPQLRAELEHLVHPIVRDELRARLELARSQRIPRVVLDVPLLLENDAAHQLMRECDALVFVHSNATVRAERARRTRGWAGSELERREAAQSPLEFKRARADVVIDNDGDLDQLNERVALALREIERRARAD